MSVLYIYAVVPTGSSWNTAGIGGVPVTGIQEGELTALVHTAEDLERALPAERDVEQAVLSHVTVVERAWEHFGAVIPVRFNVLIEPDEARTAEQKLREWLRNEASMLTQRLEALRARVELRVDIGVSRDAAVANDSEVEALRTEMERKPPGVRRLLQRKLEQVQKDAANRLADRIYPRIRQRLAEASEELHEQRRARGPEETVPVITASLLVAETRIDEIGTLLSALQNSEPALRVRFLGPWPPYSFGVEP